MPVELPRSRWPGEEPAPPRVIVWVCAFAFCMLAGAGVALFAWPADVPTNTAWFWTCVLAFPALTWCVVFGLRMHFYEEHIQERHADEIVLQTDEKHAVQFASEPLAVTGYGYLSAQGSCNVAASIVQGIKTLQANTPRSGIGSVRHTMLVLSGDGEFVALRYRSAFMELLGLCAGAINSAPLDVPLRVYLQFPSQVGQTLMLDTWKTCWDECEFRPAEASLCDPELGLMQIDEWLDRRRGPELEQFALFVSVQLNDIPPPGSAEVAVAVLLGWAPLVARSGLKPRALLHRPVDAANTPVNDAMTTAVRWGGSSASDLADLWLAGLDGHDRSTLLRAASDIGLDLYKKQDLSGIHDIDAALGDGGVAAGLLSIALAIDNVQQTGKAQLVAWRENSLRLAVVRQAAIAERAEVSL